jgi:predicted nucleic acid-binding protein
MGLSCLTDPEPQLVLDASTAINLNATGCAAAILRALPNDVIVTDVVFEELQEDLQSGRKDGELMAKLAVDGIVQVEKVSDLSQPHFENLVIGHGPDTLEDGEASTLAYAVQRGAVPVIDERKARRICSDRFPATKVASTVDLLCHDAVIAAVGSVALADAVFAALRNARMRVLAQHEEWVVGLIGTERAQLCASLSRRSRTVARQVSETK